MKDRPLTGFNDPGRGHMVEVIDKIDPKGGCLVV